MKIELIIGSSVSPWSFWGEQSTSNLISAIALIAGLFSGTIALLAWRTSARHNADEHVHRLFSEYLNVRLTYDDHSKSSENNGKEYIDNQIIGMKLYILEEMHTWVSVQRSLQYKLNILIPFISNNIARNDILNSWNRTIVTHALQDFVKTKKGLQDYASCYGVEFISFIAEQAGDAQLLDLARAHKKAVQEGVCRPLGEREKEQISEARAALAETSDSG